MKLVIIDYLQKIRPSFKHEKRTYEVGQVSGTLKGVAEKCAVSMLTLAQLNRDADNQRPRLRDLADSGQIERDADVVEDVTKLIIAKNRDGELGEIDLLFLGRYCRFENRKRP